MEIVIFGRFQGRARGRGGGSAARGAGAHPRRAGMPGASSLPLAEGPASLLRAFALGRHSVVRTPRGAAPHAPHARMCTTVARPSAGHHAFGLGLVTGETDRSKRFHPGKSFSTQSFGSGAGSSKGVVSPGRG